MSLSETKTQSVFATPILVSAVVLCWSAEAAPRNPGYKQIVRSAGPDIATQIGKVTDTVTCYVYNKSEKNVCVVYDVYPVWYFAQARRGTVSRYIPGKTGLSIAWAFPSQQSSMQCKLVSARYVTPHDLCQ